MSEDHYIVSGLDDACTDTEITIPNVYRGLPVTEIERNAFRDRRGLKSVTIGRSVTTIGHYAFGGCFGLTSITVEEGNATYHSEGNCLIKTESMTLILGCNTSVIPDDGSVIRIEDYAFSGCSELTSITIPDGVTSIGDYVFNRIRDTAKTTKNLLKQPLSRA